MTESEKLPRAIYGSDDTAIKIGDISIPCYVLDDNKRVLSQRGMLKALGMSTSGTSREGDDRLASFVSGNRIKELMDNELITRIKNPTHFITASGKTAFGYDALILQSVVRGLSKAYLQGKLLKQQEHIGINAEILDDAFSKVGVIALIDEATGYQTAVDRAKDELQQLLSKFLLKEHAKWLKTFPDEFFEMIFKMKGFSWNQANKGQKPQWIGHIINDLIYARLAPLVLNELREKNPVKPSTGSRKTKHHQWLTPDLGHPKLKEHLSGVMALGRASGYDWNTFIRMMDKSYPKFGHTMELLLNDEVKPKKIEKTPFDKTLGALMKVPKPEKD